jgi:hypothetical protein
MVVSGVVVIVVMVVIGAHGTIIAAILSYGVDTNHSGNYRRPTALAGGNGKWGMGNREWVRSNG